MGDIYIPTDKSVVQKIGSRIIRVEPRHSSENRNVPIQTLDTEDFYNGDKRASQWIEYGLAMMEVGLALRFIFMFLGASNNNIFANIIYYLTFPIVIPFMGLFGSHPSSGLAKPELETLIAMLVWAVTAWACIGLLTINKRQKLRLP